MGRQILISIFDSEGDPLSTYNVVRDICNEGYLIHYDRLMPVQLGLVIRTDHKQDKYSPVAYCECIMCLMQQIRYIIDDLPEDAAKWRIEVIDFKHEGRFSEAYLPLYKHEETNECSMKSLYNIRSKLIDYCYHLRAPGEPAPKWCGKEHAPITSRAQIEHF